MTLHPYCKYHSVRQAALDIHESLAAPKGKKFSPRPYNRYDPENSLWWLIPSADWPAYKYGKIAISKEQEGKIYFGLNIEKAIGQEAAACYQSKKAQKIIMGSDWCWYEFLKALTEGEVAATMDIIQKNSNGLPLHFSLSGHIIDDPALFDPYSEYDYGDRVVWNYSEGYLNSLVQPEHFFYPVRNVTKIKDLPKALNQINELSWLWIDVYIGVILQNHINLNETEARKACNGYFIWQKIIEPWEPWLR